MTERNIELLEKTMQHLKDNPNSHEQTEWWCGTTGCFFGWGLALAGLQLDEDDWTVISGGYFGMELPDAAAEVLGLDKREARILSGGSNTIPELELMVKDLINGDELREREYYEEEVNG